MLRKLALVVVVGLTGNLAALGAEPARDASRGELLYTKACVACHTTQVHWRDRKIAADWKGLQAQVRRWQGTTGQKWSEADIAEVAGYLNSLYYHYPATD